MSSRYHFFFFPGRQVQGFLSFCQTTYNPKKATFMRVSVALDFIALNSKDHWPTYCVSEVSVQVSSVSLRCHYRTFLADMERKSAKKVIIAENELH